MRDDLIEEVRAACRQAPAIAGVSVVIDEPYAPYIPPRWNGRLVVAEAQNLAGDTEYVRRLKAATPEDRISRLHRSASEHLGIGPWDDGTLKLAVTAAWPDLSCDDWRSRVCPHFVPG